MTGSGSRVLLPLVFLWTVSLGLKHLPRNWECAYQCSCMFANGVCVASPAKSCVGWGGLAGDGLLAPSPRETLGFQFLSLSTARGHEGTVVRFVSSSEHRTVCEGARVCTRGGEGGSEGAASRSRRKKNNDRFSVKPKCSSEECFFAHPCSGIHWQGEAVGLLSHGGCRWRRRAWPWGPCVCTCPGAHTHRGPVQRRSVLAGDGQ